MENSYLNTKEYEGRNYQAPLISEAEAQELIENKKYQIIFNSFSSEAKNWALPSSPTDDNNLDRRIDILEEDGN